MMTMASNPFSLCTISLLLILCLSPCSLADRRTSIYNNPNSICNLTVHPEFCKSVLPLNKPGTIFDYGRISISRSLSNARNFLSLVKHFSKLASSHYQSAVGALEDCQLLSELNIQYLSTTLEAINSTDTLESSKAIDFQTLLSATMTNQETCSDSLLQLAPAYIKNHLLAPLSNGSMHYSTSLGLFAHGWVHHINGGRLLTENRHVFANLEEDGDDESKDYLPLTMSTQNRQLYESVSGRRLLQAAASPNSNNSSILVSQMVVVNANGTGNFTTISDAVAAAPNNTANGTGYFVIYVVKGVYNEYVSIPAQKNYLMMIGDGIKKTVITGNRSVVDGWTTFNSATFAVLGQGFVAVNITFRNTAGAIKQQAVAVRNGADMSTFYKCSFEGYQDTLYAHSLRQFYRACRIYGTIDYIFGNAAVVFQKCDVYSRLPLVGQFNTITAQGRTDPNQNTGTSVQKCKILAAPDLLASGNGTVQTYLGRPWKPYSRTVFMQSFMGSLINPAGWVPWSVNSTLNTLYYAEFNNTGPGSKTTNRVKWPGFHLINATDAANFTVSNFTQGGLWLPSTGVPFSAGL